MADLVGIRTSVATYILDRDDLDTEINKAINLAIGHYSKQQFFFNSDVSTFSTVASQESYSTSDSIPSDMTGIYDVRATYNSTKFELRRQDYKTIAELNSASSTGLPTDYAFYGNKFYFYPIPDAAYTITVAHRKNYTDLSDDSDSNDFTTYAEELITARASWWVAHHVIHDSQISQNMKISEMEAKNQLLNQSISMGTNGKMSGGGFYASKALIR